MGIGGIVRPMSAQARAALRRALRVSVVMPPAFAASVFIAHNPEITTFLAFGCFALMVLADFGGTRRPRAAAYLLTTAAGAAMVALGTLASNNSWSAVAVTLILAFCVRFAGIFGGYVRAAQGALLLSLVLAVAFPGAPQTIVPRLIGWSIAGGLATISALVLWPRFEQAELRRRAAEGCRALADLIGVAGHADAAVIDDRAGAAAETVGGLFSDYYATPRRPAWPTRTDRALSALLIDLDSTVAFAAPFLRELNGRQPWIAEGRELSGLVAETLHACGDLLDGGAAAPDLQGLENAQAGHRAALDSWVGGAPRSGRAPREILDQLHAETTLSFITYLAVAIGANVMLVAGRDVASSAATRSLAPRREGFPGVAIRVGKSLRTHLTPRSPVLHDAVRVAVGLALAVLAGRLLPLSHAFWVVLGTSSALRSNVLATGRTALQAVGGTLVGVVVGGVFVALAGTNSVVDWSVLPVAAFTATYVSGAAGFVLGQAAFSVFVILLFNLIAPAGWQIGLIRIEDVALGVGISILTGLLLWPQGTRRDVTDAIARMFVAASAFLGESLELVLGRGSSDRAKRERVDALRARDRADEALEQFLAERTGGPLTAQAAASLVASGTHAVLFGELIDVLPDMGYRADHRAAGIDAVETQLRRLVDELKGQAGRIQGRNGASSGERVSAAALQEAALASLERSKHDPDARQSTFAVLAAAAWVQFMDGLVARLDQPIDQAVAAARLPWWR